VHAAPATVAPVSVVPEHGSGFPGRPGLLGSRPDGRGWAPRFRPARHALDGDCLTVEALDDVAGLALTTTISLDHALSVRVEVTNLSPDEPYRLGGLSITLPVPARASELLTLGGRWGREFQVRRTLWPAGAHTVENLGAAHPTNIRRCCSPATPASERAPARCGALTSPGPATMRSWPSDCPTGGGTCNSANSSIPARSPSRLEGRTAAPRWSPSTARRG